MTAASGEFPFGQADYNKLTAALDQAMAHLKGLGMPEDKAQACLRDFVDGHYFAVWRAMHPEGEDFFSATVRQVREARAGAFPHPMVPDPSCGKCGGRGEVAQAGSYFRGGPVTMPCDCRKPG